MAFPKSGVIAIGCLATLGACAPVPIEPPPVAPMRATTHAQVIEQSTPADWRSVDPQNTLYLELPTGRVVIELAPLFAPAHVENIKTLVRGKYFDGLRVTRAQENYVVQWGDPDGKRDFEGAARSLPAEFTSMLANELRFTPLPDGDLYAPEVGFSGGFPVARDKDTGLAWMAHCYGMVGVGRGVAPNSGSGAELYVVIGHAPRHLDRNVTLVGRVLDGMEHLTTLPRGSGPLGFYEKDEPRVPIKAMRVAADVSPAQRTELEVLRTDTAAFVRLIEARRFRREEWFVEPGGNVELCNMPVPVRRRTAR